MVPVVLDELLEAAADLYKVKPLSWTAAEPTPAELEHMQEEALTPSEFDPLRLKKTTWNSYKKGTLVLACYECQMGKVIAILPKGFKVPLDDWGRILQWIGPAASGEKWGIFWFGATSERKFPQKGQPLTAEHLNGGYTAPCSTNGIFIYRFEEATRVLLHELLHAACLDPPGESLPVREATIETWAELFLIALRAKGDKTEGLRLWRIQSQWVANKNRRATNNHGVLKNTNYGWRYMNGRAKIYKELGCELPEPKPINQKGGVKIPNNSSRFTAPNLD
jgi:hypothetical protein